MTASVRSAWTPRVLALAVALGCVPLSAQTGFPTASVQPQAFVGYWVGTQNWDIANPPPGAIREQPVAIRIDLVDGKLVGVMKPFMGGEDGAVLVNPQIVGDELRATAVFGTPEPGAAPVLNEDTTIPELAKNGVKIVPSNGASRRAAWKDTVTIRFTFKADGVNMTGHSEIAMNNLKWLAFNYDLSKKRARY